MTISPDMRNARTKTPAAEKRINKVKPLVELVAEKGDERDRQSARRALVEFDYIGDVLKPNPRLDHILKVAKTLK